jgi:probable rRNA maturation factor
MIYFIENDKKVKIAKRSAKDELTFLCENEGFVVGDLNVVFCSDSFLLEMNKTHLNHDYFTDIITFDFCEGKIINGELYISVDRVEDNVKVLNIPFDVELKRIIFHGVLHLCGFKDKSSSDKIQMTSKEDYYLKYFKYI